MTETAAADVARMTAQDIVEALTAKWPDSEHLLIPEAPQDSARAGRKIDLLVVACWRSRGFQRDAVEIKTSLADWRRELANPRKADFWWRHAHRFWVAVPALIAPQVHQELPEGWGLLACKPGSVRVTVAAQRHDVEDLTLDTIVGLLRAAADAGAGALGRARTAGYDDGYEHGRKDGLRESGSARYDALEQKVREFEQAAGISILDDAYTSGADLGKAFDLARHWSANPERVVRALERLHGSLRLLTKEAAQHIESIRDAILPDQEEK